MSGKSAEERRENVRRMFDRIAPRYDLLNTILSFGQDRRWRKRSVRKLGLPPGGVLLDVAAGTGDVALAAARACPRLKAAIALDFSHPMLQLARRKIKRIRSAVPILAASADATSLPLADEAVDAVTIAFGIRNVVDVPRALAEMARVLRPGGRLLILEFAEPGGRMFGPLFRWYFTRMLPRIGGLISGLREAYEYLPRSVGQFFKPQELKHLMRKAGFHPIGADKYSCGVVIAYYCEKSLSDEMGVSNGG